MPILRTEVKIPSSHGYDIPCLDGTFPGQKAVICCLHGFGGSKGSSRIGRLHYEMVPHKIGTFAFDWPGHGENQSGFSKLTVQNCLEDLEQIYKYVSETYQVPVWCFATSFGGYLAVLYLSKHPESFEKIMLRSPALKMGQIMIGFMDEEERNSFLRGEPKDFGFDQPLVLTRSFYDDTCAHDAFSVVPAHPERMVIIQGDHDETVDPQHSIEFAKKNGIKIYLLQGADHEYSNPGDIDRVMDRAKEFYLAAD